MMNAIAKTPLRAITSTLLVFVASSLLPSAALSQATPEIKVRWGINNPYFPGNTPINIGVKTGIFKKHGLLVEAVQTQSPMPPLLAGSTDLTTGGAPPWMSAMSQGQKPVAIATVLPKNSQALMVKPDSPVAKFKGQWPGALEALRGKKIGVTVPGAQVDLTTRYLLMKAGLEPDKDVTIVSLGGGTPQVSALDQGRVDAIMTFVPFVQILEAANKAVTVFDYTSPPPGMPAAVDQPYMIVVGNAKFMNDNPQISTRVRAALDEVQQWMMAKENTPALRDELQTGFGVGVTPETIDAIIDQLRRGGVRTEYNCTDFANGIDLMKALNKMDKDYACSEYVVKP
jgi:NitT/TauT family transport system substrate-binding protein